MREEGEWLLQNEGLKEAGRHCNSTKKRSGTLREVCLLGEVQLTVKERLVCMCTVYTPLLYPVPRTHISQN